MALSPEELVSEALAAWIIKDIGRSNDFAREGLPGCDVPRLLHALGASVSFSAPQFSIALVGFGIDEDNLRLLAAAAGLTGLSGTSTDLHVATDWRNLRDAHPRIIALARGYNPSVHGLRFFARASSSQLAGDLLGWAEKQAMFRATPQHRALLEALAGQRGLAGLRSLEGVARFLSHWSAAPAGDIDAPREALPALGLLPDPRLFEAKDLGRELERNLELRELVTVLAPGEIRQRRMRAERYRSSERREALSGALDRLEAFRAGDGDAGLTLQDAERLVRPPADAAATLDEVRIEDADREPEDRDERQGDLVVAAADALIAGRQEDLDAIGTALEAAWEEFDQNGDRLAASAETSHGVIPLDMVVDTKLLDWVTAFCGADRFGGLIETDALDLKQALARFAEFNPSFIDPDAIWSHNGQVRSLAELLAGWDQIAEVRESGGRPLTEVWRDFLACRAGLAGSIRPLIVHPREWLDTHPATRDACRAYLALATELYGQIQRHYQAVWGRSRDWAQATLDALLSLDIVQVRMMTADRSSAKAVMLPLHPLHLWRYQRLGEVLRDFARLHRLDDADREALLEELQRPEQFLSVVRTGATPDGRGLNQLLPVANDIDGLATFENLHNAVSSADGVETLVQALDHYALLYPNHVRPLRVALINPPEPARLLERIIKLLDGRRQGGHRLNGIEIDILATSDHRDRLVAAATLEGRAQDLVYEKIASGRLDLRVASAPAEDLKALIASRLGGRAYHIAALFDGSTIAIRKRRVERLLPMSPFCVRNEIVVDELLGEISLSPHPGEPPFSDFVMMIQELEQEQRDSTMFASADANALRAAVDTLVMGDAPLARWALLADRALPTEEGMRSVRLLARPEGRRQVLLSAADHGRLATLMYAAFQNCNLSVSSEMLDQVLRQGANLVGAGLLDMIKKQSGQPDPAKVVGFVGMLLAARQAHRLDPNALIAAVDGRVARLWLRLGPRHPSDRCDLLCLRREEDGGFRLSCIEVKTTLDASLPDEADRVDRAAQQIAATASVIASALDGEDMFAAPRLEMLKEVLVRAASARWSSEAEDTHRRQTWGPWLQQLFGQQDERPAVRIDGEVVIVKLRSADRPRQRVLRTDQVPITVSTITEILAEELLAPVRGRLNPGPPDGSSPPLVSDDRQAGAAPIEPGVEAQPPPGRDVDRGPPAPPAPPQLSPSGLPASIPNFEAPTAPAPILNRPSEQLLRDGGHSSEAWPPPVNSLGMIGQLEAARELVNLVRKAKGWGERFPDKLLVGPAGVGKSTLARRIGEELLGVTPILFNGADLRRPEMIVERLIELEKVPQRATGTIEVAPCLIFIDEVHAIHPSVATALLSALDDRRTTTVGNTVYSFDQVVFLLATTDPGRLTEAFLSRPTRTTLRSYTLNEMAGIVWLHARDLLDGSQLSREACIEIAARMQCSPRPSVNILNPLIAHFYGMAEAALDDVPSRRQVAAYMTEEAIGDWFSETLSIDANGLGPLHHDYLNVLRKRGAASEDELRRALGVSNRGDFVELTEYLTRLQLITVGPGGRLLTPDGRRYLSTGGQLDLRDRISRRIAGG